MKIAKMNNRRSAAIRIAEAKVRIAERVLRNLKESEQKTEKIKFEDFIEVKDLDAAVKNVLQVLADEIESMEDTETLEDALTYALEVVADPGFFEDDSDAVDAMTWLLAQSDKIQKLDVNGFLALCRTYGVKVTVNFGEDDEE